MRRYDLRLVRESNAHPDKAPPAVPTLAYEAPKSPDAYVEATATGAVLVLPESSATRAYVQLFCFMGAAAVLDGRQGRGDLFDASSRLRDKSDRLMV